MLVAAAVAAAAGGLLWAGREQVGASKVLLGFLSMWAGAPSAAAAGHGAGERQGARRVHPAAGRRAAGDAAERQVRGCWGRELPPCRALTSLRRGMTALSTEQALGATLLVPSLHPRPLGPGLAQPGLAAARRLVLLGRRFQVRFQTRDSSRGQEKAE